MIQRALIVRTRSTLWGLRRRVVSTAGVPPSVARHLRRHAPGPDCLWSRSSVNCWPVPDALYGVSWTIGDGWDAAAQPLRVATQWILMPRVQFARFAYNPFAVVDAMAELDPPDDWCERRQLEPLSLLGRTPVSRPQLVERLRQHYSTETICRMLDAALTQPQLVLAEGTESGRESESEAGPEAVIAAMLELVPPTLRPQLSFSTGLRRSACRPLRLVGVARHGDSADGGVDAVLDRVPSVLPLAAPRTPWARLLLRLLVERREDLLPDLMRSSQAILGDAPRLADLGWLAARLRRRYGLRDGCELIATTGGG